MTVDPIKVVIEGDADDVVREVKRARRETKAAVEGMAADAKRASGVYQDAAGRWREANGRFVTSARQVELGLDRAAKSSDRASSAYRRQGVALKGLKAGAQEAGRSLDQLGSAGRRAATGVTAVGTAMAAGAIKEGIRFNASMESNRIALTQLTGSAKEADRLLSDLFKTARQTPFEFGQVTDAAKKFLAFGFTVKDTEKDLRAIGDAVASLGGGSEKIDRLVIALGQIKAKGKVQGDELLQLAEAGIPAYQILQEKLKLTQKEVANIGKVGIPAKVAIDALIEGMTERFAGMTKKQSQSFDGMWSSIKDDSKQAFGAMTEGLFLEMKRWMPAVDKTAQDIAAIWNRKNLTPEEKFKRSREAIERDLGPLFNLVEQKLKNAHIEEHLIDAFNKALPVIAEKAGEMGLKAAGAFGDAFMDADPLGKLVLAGFASKKLGLWAAAGKLAGGAFSKGAAEGAGGAGGKTGGGLLRSPLGLAATGVGVGLLINEVSERKQASDSEKMLKRIVDLAKDGKVPLNDLRQALDDAGRARDLLHIKPSQVKQARDALEEYAAKIRQIQRLAKDGIDVDVDVQATSKQLKDVEIAFDRMRKSAGGSVRDIRLTTRENMTLIYRALRDGSQESRDALATNYRLAADAVKKSMDAGTVSTKTGLAEIDRLMRKYLGEYGIKGKEATRYLNGQDTKTGKVAPTSTDHTNAARGGFWLGNKGEAGRDTVPMDVNGQPVIAARGEYVGIFNRHQKPALDAALQQQGYGNLESFLAANPKPHYMASGGVVPAAKGGTFEATAYGPPWGGIEGTGITSTGIKLPNAPTGKAGPYIVAVDPTVIPYHTKFKAWPNPFGYRGDFQAEDTGGAIKGNRLDFLDMISREHQNAWGRRNVQVSIGGTASALDAMMGAGTATTNGKPDAKKIKRVLAGLGGPLGGIVQGGLDRVRAAAQAKVDAAAPADTGGAGGGFGGGTFDLGGGTGGHPELKQKISQVAAAVLASAPGLSITSTTGGNHVSDSWHYQGRAVDIGGPVPAMYKASEWIKSSGLYRDLLEGIHNPNLSISDGHPVDPSFYSGVWAGHADHIHLAAAVGALLGRSGQPGTADDPQSVKDWAAQHAKDRKADAEKDAKKKRKKKTRTPATKVDGPGRPNLSKVKGTVKKAAKTSTDSLPKWLAQYATPEDAFDRFANALIGGTMEDLFGIPIEHVRALITQREGLNALSEEQATVYDVDGNEVLNQSGTWQGGKFIGGIDQASAELRALMMLHTGTPDGSIVASQSLLGLLQGQAGAIGDKLIPAYGSDRDAVLRRLAMFKRIWQGRRKDKAHEERVAAGLRSEGLGWEQRVANNTARIKELQDYQRDIHDGTNDDNTVLSSTAKKNLSWANQKIADLREENTKLKDTQPGPVFEQAKKGETGDERRKRLARNAEKKARLTLANREIASATRDMAAVSGGTDAFDPTTGLAGQYTARLDHDTTILGDLARTLRGLNDTDIPAEQLAVLQIAKDLADLQNTSINFKPTSTSGTGSDVREGLLQQQRDEAIRALSVSESQRLVIEGFAPLLNARFFGSFARGTDGVMRVPDTGMLRVHKDELVQVQSDPAGPFGSQMATAPTAATAPEIKVYIEGDTAPLMRKVRAEIDGYGVRVAGERIGRHARVLRIAPGG